MNKRRLSSRLRMQAWRLSSAMNGGRTPTELAKLEHEFQATMDLLREGDPSRPLAVPWNATTRQHFERMDRSWNELRPAWQHSGAYSINDLTPRVDAFVERVDELVLAIEDKLARLTAIRNLFQFLMMVLAVLTAVLILYVAHLFVLEPLERKLGVSNRVHAAVYASERGMTPG